MDSAIGEKFGRVAALDLGDVWTGIAVSDPTRSIASPVEVISSGEVEDCLARFSEEGITEVVVGVPKTLSGGAGYQARRVLDRLSGFRDEFKSLKFVEWDERFTTRIAREGVGGGRSGRRKARRRENTKERVDHLAAAQMLQEYLESGRDV